MSSLHSSYSAPLALKYQTGRKASFGGQRASFSSYGKKSFIVLAPVGGFEGRGLYYKLFSDIIYGFS
jgi:hypothetical protein